MQSACTLIICFAAIHAKSEARQDELFASWQEAQRTAMSLVVDFNLERRLGSFSDKAEGTFRLIRTPNGRIFASYRIYTGEESFFIRDFSGLLNDGTVYILNEKEKTASNLRSIQGDLMQFLEEYFNPFVLLLDKKYAKEKCYFELVKQDEWYTYLMVTPKDVKREGWFCDQFHKGRVVLMSKASEGVPKDMPREIRYIDGIRENIFAIKSWRFNAPDAPKEEEFTKPEDRPGWQVYDWATGGMTK